MTLDIDAGRAKPSADADLKSPQPASPGTAKAPETARGPEMAFDSAARAAEPVRRPGARAAWETIGGLIPFILRILRQRGQVGAAAHLMAIRILALFGNICCGLLTAKFLGPEGRGELAALLIAPSVLAAFCTLGLHVSLIYNLRADPERGSGYFGSAVILSFLAGVIASGIGFLLIPLWLSQYSNDTIFIARLLLVVLPLSTVSPVCIVTLESFGRFGLGNSVLYIQSLTTLAILGLLTAFGWLSAHSAAYAYTGLSIPTFIYLAIQARRVLRPTLTMRKPYPRHLLRYGLQYYGVDVLGTLSSYLDQLVIVYLLQPEAVGAYAVALSLSRLLGIAQGVCATVLFPSIAAREVERVVELVARALRVTTAINVTIAVGMALTGPSFLLLLYGARFAPSVAPFLVLLLQGLVTGAARTLAQAFSGTGRPGAFTRMEFVGVVASLGAMLILVPTFGIVGAAAATLIGGCVRLIYVLATFRAVLGVSLPRLVISRSDIAWVAGR